ncbi:MAG TPA: thiamine-phosphate kinase [Bacteroidales bacterium]|nr:thiamine-phosphate kinase [Bacteroidales bacterium]
MSEQKNQVTPLSELGEFGLIHRLTLNLSPGQPSTVKGVGDDAAVLRFGEHTVLVSKDLLVENVHFDLSYYPLRHLGYKAAVVNISDIVAMNGRATHLLVGLAVSSKFSVEAIEEVFAGIRLACERYELDLVGGDTTSSTSGLMISITVIGQARAEDVTYRHTASAGDLICVSGDLGSAYAGLLVLEREKHAFRSAPGIQPDLEGFDYILERQLKPEARTEVPDILRQIGVRPSAMIDVSDGLSSEILHLCEASGLGCTLYTDRIPLDPATVSALEDFGIDPLTAALNGGEDYELLFTVPLKDYDRIRDIQGIHLIGHMSPASEGRFLQSPQGTRIPLTAQGWDAYPHTTP